MKTDLESILRQMTLEEKAAICTGETAWTIKPIERLGVPSLFMSDGPHGLRREAEPGAMGAPSLPATCFPTASCLASTWDVDLVYALGQALGEECLALNVDVLLGPGVNMKRSPLCGRNFEYFSEDPFLAGELAVSFIQGVQSKGVGTSLKHFAANNQETERFRINAIVDERTLYEIYLPAFETAVKKGKPWTVMCAYNKLNGFYCSEHRELLIDILRKKWGFEGLVVSDWGAVHDRVASLKAGVDLEMPGPKPHRTQAVIEAVRSGSLDEKVLDEAVRHILELVFKAAETPKGGELAVEEHHALARRIAGEGMVLLKNNGLLPLRGLKSLAVIGRSAKEPYFQGGGSSHVNPTRVDIPFDEIAKLAGDIHLTYAEGYPVGPEMDQRLIEEAVVLAQEAEAAVLFIALPMYKESEGYDRTDLKLTAQQEALIQAVTKVQPKTVVVLNNGSAVTMGDWLQDTAAILEAWMMGQAGGGAVADILFGVVNPSGKLSETFPLKLEDTPAYLNFPGSFGEVRYGEGIYIGYRYYEAKQVPVQFPFGFGLSYTQFGYSNLRISPAQVTDRDIVTISVDITNLGKMTGKEIVQVYIHDRISKVPRPLKELKGFAKVELQPGETKTVTISLEPRAFAYYHPLYKEWVIESGEFDILVGASSSDIRLQGTVFLESTQRLPSLLNRESTLREWLDDPRGKQVIEPVFQMMKAEMSAAFSSGEEKPDVIGMDMMGFLLDMTLVNILGFQEGRLPVPPEALVDSWLEQVRTMD